VTSGGLVVYLLVTVVSVVLGVAYATAVGRRLGMSDWRRWALLVPFWVLYVVVLLTMDMRDLAPQAVGSFAFGSFAQTVIDSLGALRRRRVGPPTRHDDGVTPLL
jgi:hypothetical protein